MSDKILKQILARDPEEKEFHQAVREFVETVTPVLERHPEYHKLVKFFFFRISCQDLL